MTDPRHESPSAPPPDKGGGAKRRQRVYLLIGGALLLALAGCYGWMRMKPPTQASTPASGTGAAVDASGMPADAGNGQAIASSTSPMPNEPGDTTPDLKDFIPPGQEPPVGEVIAKLRAAGIHTGIAAFNPPGTSPPLIGIAVPEDFPLPEGFVRHTQATDDGQRIEPILMFSPDYDFYDSQGRPIQVPDNRVVPPKYAPPGLKIRMIRIPPPL